MEETTQYPQKIENQGIVYQDRNQKVEKIIAKFENFKKVFFVARAGKRAALVVAKNREILFVRQYRLLINDLSYEIPGGKVNENEPPQKAAVRETEEETGIYCTDLRPLINYQSGLDIFDNYTHLFYAHNFKKITDVDSLNLIWISLEDCFAMIKSGKIIDSLSIIAIYSYEKMIQQGNA